MSLGRISLADAKLYLILDTQVQDYDRLFETLKQAVRSGVDIVQLRDKFGSARDILAFSKRTLTFLKGRIPFIINDRVDLAGASLADGVHLGQDDLPLTFARKVLGKKKIIGISCQTFRQAREAQEAGADYIGFGSVFKTLTKPERHPMDLRLLARVVKNVNIPVFAIGGISPNNLTKIYGLGTKRVAVTRAICLSDNIPRMTRKFLEVLDCE